VTETQKVLRNKTIKNFFIITAKFTFVFNTYLCMHLTSPTCFFVLYTPSSGRISYYCTNHLLFTMLLCMLHWLCLRIQKIYLCRFTIFFTMIKRIFYSLFSMLKKPYKYIKIQNNIIKADGFVQLIRDSPCRWCV